MKNIDKIVGKLKIVLGRRLNSVHLVGSYLDNPESANDIDFLIYSDKLYSSDIEYINYSFAGDRVRLQRNRYESPIKNGHDVDLIFIENKKLLEQFLSLNQNATQLYSNN